jgi:outer membrane cobalamin receptor
VKKYFTILLFISISISTLNYSIALQQDKPIKNLEPDSTKKPVIPLSDSLKNTVQRKLSSIKSKNLLNNNFDSNILRKNILNRTDYRNASEFFLNYPFGFIRDLGSLGQPSEVLLYGHGFKNITFLNDGIQINNRLSNSFDINLIQSEGLDSLEIIPLPRGFLYGCNSNISTINIIPADYSFKKPFTRIKFYQAPNDEGIFDGIFNAHFSERLSIFFEVTNQSTLPRFRNSDLSLWQATARLRYIANNKLTLIGNFSYARSIVQLFGGVDADTIRANFSSDQFEEILYDKFLAPVKFNYRYQKASTHLFSMRFLGDFIKNTPTDLTLFYNSGLIEYRQNETDSSNMQTNIDKFMHNNEFSAFGMRLNQDFYLGIGKLFTILEIEKTEINTPLLIKDKSNTNFASSSRFSFELPSSLGQLNIFGKYSKYFGKNYSGYGLDGFISISNSLSVYTGLSNFQKPFDLFVNEADLYSVDKTNLEKVSTAEVKLNYSSESFDISLSYFSQNLSNHLLSTIIKKLPINNDEAHFFIAKDIKLKGLNWYNNFSFWKLNLITNTSLYFNDENRNELGLPQFTSYGGIYYIDTLFNSNLQLKMGINYSSLGKRIGLNIDFERNISTTYTHLIGPSIRSIPNKSSGEFDPEFQLDFFLAGTIQENATLYFVFENLLNNKYFIVPFYPQRERGIRFGVAWEFFD